MHTPREGWPYWAGLHPIHAFFIVAGFYSFLSMRKADSISSDVLKSYYGGRLLRLYPVFIVSAILTLVWSFVFPLEGYGYNPRWGLMTVSAQLDPAARALLWAPSFTLVGTDAMAWFNLVAGNRLEIAPPFEGSDPPRIFG
jgi:peptidoglycan/LPS O-acetylase OafA/YrhL